MDINNVISNLNKNNMQAVYVEDRSQAIELVKEMLFKNASIVTGGSVTLSECGITQMLSDEGYNILDRSDKSAMFNADFFVSAVKHVVLVRWDWI